MCYTELEISKLIREALTFIMECVREERLKNKISLVDSGSDTILKPNFKKIRFLTNTGIETTPIVNQKVELGQTRNIISVDSPTVQYFPTCKCDIGIVDFEQEDSNTSHSNHKVECHCNHNEYSGSAVLLSEINKINFLPNDVDMATLSEWEAFQFKKLFLIFETLDLNSQQIEEMILRSDAMLDSIWQRLHTGHWSEVPVTLRVVYTWSTIILIYLSLQRILTLFRSSSESKSTDHVARKASSVDAIQNADSIQCCQIDQISQFRESSLIILQRNIDCEVRKIISICDRGLLMGYPIKSNPLAKIAHTLNLLASRSTENEVSSSLEKDMFEAKQWVDCSDSFSCLNEITALTAPPLDLFLLKYLSLRRPVKLLHIIDHWPAAQKWNFTYLQQIAGARTVPVEIGARYTDDDWSQVLLTIEDYITKYITKRVEGKPLGYLAQHQLFDQIPQLLNDIIVPDYCAMGESPPRLNAWIGPKGTVSPLHQDPDHNIFVQIFGYKYLRLYPEDQSEKIYPRKDHLLSNTSQINLEDESHLQHWPLLKDAEGYYLKLGPGEAVYIPPKCWHYVRSLTNSISVSFWWS